MAGGVAECKARFEGDEGAEVFIYEKEDSFDAAVEGVLIVGSRVDCRESGGTGVVVVVGTVRGGIGFGDVARR